MGILRRVIFSLERPAFSPSIEAMFKRSILEYLLQNSRLVILRKAHLSLRQVDAFRTISFYLHLLLEFDWSDISI